MSDQPPYHQPYPANTGYLPYATSVPLKHSGLGIASFIIAIVMGLMEFAMVVLAAVLVQKGASPKSPSMMLAGCSMLSGLAVIPIGIVLGILGVLQENRGKVFAILGICINGMMLLCVIGLLIAGLMHR